MREGLKKLVGIGTFLFISLGAFAGVLKVGASPVPHSEILNLVKEDLKAEGIDLKIIEMSDYVTPNLALNDGEIDVNFFQHKPYLDKFSQERNLDLKSVAKIHIEPLGFYSKKIKTTEDLKKGNIIAIPNDPSNGGRALILLHNNGLIKLNDPSNLYATEFDIAENPKKIKFKAVEAAQLPRILPDIAGAVINSNYALEAGLKPTKDAILIEGEESPYANILVVKKENENNEDIKKLIEKLKTEKVKNFIIEKYKGAVVTAF